MDQEAFDAIAKLMGGAATRRTGIGATIGALLGSGIGGAEARRRRRDASDRGQHRAPKPQGPCGDRSGTSNLCRVDGDCCTGYCQRKPGADAGRCRCVHTGKPCKPSQTCCGGATCAGGVCPRLNNCAGNGKPCAKSRDCCRGRSCIDGACRRPEPCHTAGQTCASQDACCNGLVCDGGVCADCLPGGAACTKADTCCGGKACIGGICQAPPPPVATGAPCDPGIDTCVDPNASCTTYSVGTPAGDHCLLPRAKSCAADTDCRSQRCRSGVCKPCSAAGCVGVCTPTVCSACTYTTVQGAIDNATAGDTIDIGAGTYVEDLTVTKNLTLRACPSETVIFRNLTSSGTAASAKRTITASGAHLILIDITVDADASYGAVYGGGIVTDADLTLAGACTVKGAYHPKGGGIRLTGDGKTLTLTDDVVIDGNSADSYGGGVLVSGESEIVVAEAVRIINNRSDSYGAGIGGENGVNVTVSGSVLFDGNRGKSGGGMGIVNWSSSRAFTISISGDVAFSNNTMTKDGGGLLVYGTNASSETVTIGGNVSFANNTAGGEGGGVFLDQVDASISDDVSITSNTATGNAGGLRFGCYKSVNSLSLSGDVVISGNSSSANGGGLYLAGSGASQATLAGTAAITGNTAVSGGGVFAGGSNYTLTAPANSITSNTPNNCAGAGISC